MDIESEIRNSEGNFPEFDIEAFLKISVEQGASDIHLRVGAPPMIRKDGLMLKTKMPLLTVVEINKVIDLLVPKKIRARIDSAYDIDFSVEVPDVSRFRINLLHDLGKLGLVLRVIPYNIPSLENLSMPPILKSFTDLNNGLVLVTGPTGCGKSTTIASLIDYLNQNKQKHIVTLEDPIEFIHTSKKCIFTQRQLGIDTDSFPNGLKYALRQDPDIILIGEMRDRETITSALKAAETGHLVFSTLHTTDAVQTINRIINAFEPHEREAIRLQIASTLRGTVTQKLIKRADNRGRVPATEILMVTPGVRDYIARDEIEKIYEIIKTSDYDGMMSMNMSLVRLVEANLITQDTALQMSDQPTELEIMLKGAFHGTSYQQF